MEQFIAFDTSIGNTGAGTSSSAYLDHAGEVAVVVVVSSFGDSNATVTIGGTSASSLASQKISPASIAHTVEVFYIYRTSEANEQIVVTFSSNTRHSWSAASYTGVDSSDPYELVAQIDYERNTQEPVTLAATLASGTEDRLIIGCNGGRDNANRAGQVDIAPNNGETERREDRLDGGLMAAAVSSQIQDYATSAQREIRSYYTHTDAADRYLNCALIVFALKPEAVTDNHSRSAFFPFM